MIFLNPKNIRYRKGRQSPIGFFEDSYNIDALQELVIHPIRSTPLGSINRVFFDAENDVPAKAFTEAVQPSSVVIVEGLFLHRTELKSFWDFSIFLDVDFHISVPRGNARFDLNVDPKHASNHRYVAGNQYYIQRCNPKDLATAVVDNNNLNAAFISKFRE